jgi:hypothetical protein
MNPVTHCWPNAHTPNSSDKFFSRPTINTLPASVFMCFPWAYLHVQCVRITDFVTYAFYWAYYGWNMWRHVMLCSRTWAKRRQRVVQPMNILLVIPVTLQTVKHGALYILFYCPDTHSSLYYDIITSLFANEMLASVNILWAVYSSLLNQMIN